MKWYTKIEGDESILETLSRQDPNDSFSITKRDTEYLLHVNEFQKYTNLDDIKRVASEYIDVLNGLLFLQEDISSAIKIHSIFRINEKGGRDIFISPEPATIHFRGYSPTIIITRNTGETIVNHPYQDTLKTALKAKSKQELKKIFNLIKNGEFEFPVLYKIIEILLSEKGSKLYEWVPKEKIRLLKRTASESRHAVNKIEPPPRPMKLSEAQEINKHLISQYISELDN